MKLLRLIIILTIFVNPVYGGTITFSNFDSKIDQDDQYIILTWERGVLQSSSDLKSNNWSDVLLFNIDGQYATSPHRVRKNRGTAMFRLTED